MSTYNPIAAVFDVLIVIGFLLIFFSPIIICIVLLVYNLVKFITSIKGSDERIKYRNKMITFIIALIIVVAAYVALLYWFAISWHM